MDCWRLKEQRCFFVRKSGERDCLILEIKQNIVLMYAIALLHGMVFYGPIATLYRQAVGVSIFQITVVEGVSMALCVLLEFPLGAAADRVGYKRMTVGCCMLYFVSKIVFWKAAGFQAFLLERILLGVVIAGLSGVDISILYLSCDKTKAQSVFAIYNNLGTTGLLLASGVYSLAVKDNYRAAGFLTVLSYGAAMFLSLGLKEVKQVGGRKRLTVGAFKAAMSRLVGDRTLVMFLIAVVMLNETHQTITVFLNQLQYVKCGIPNTIIGYIYIPITLLGLLGGFSARFTRLLGQSEPFWSCFYAVSLPASV